METKRLAGLEPAAVFHYFEEVCAIPHGSRNTKKISDYLVDFAKEHGLRYIQDGANNVILFGNGTCGMEAHAPVILQGHMDMVCAQTEDCPKDMAREGLDLATDGQYVWAEKTSLGGDDCIAVAAIFAILADDSLPHPPLEAVITVDEETGMDPAKAGAFVGKVALKTSHKPLYTIGFAYKAAVLLTKILPARALNWLIGKIYAS